MIKSFDSNRTIIKGRGQAPISTQPTVVLGVYNAENYLPQILTNIQVQSGDFKILIVDNRSTDQTWDLLQEWLVEFPDRLTLVRNSINLGGWATVGVNLDCVDTEWFIWMHQDDVYFSNHVAVLAEHCMDAENDIVCIATDMASLSANGEPNPASPPRASWGLPDTSSETLFVTNVRLHNVPNPASAFRKSAFGEFSGPWHSTAFPDTEWLLNALLKRQVKLVPQVTMAYRENPVSESHIVGHKQKEIGAFLSLNRVFSKSEFIQFARAVEARDRTKFANAILDGIGVRISDHELSTLLKVAAAEQLAFAWNYGELSTSTFLAHYYRRLGASRVVELLESMSSNRLDTVNEYDQAELFYFNPGTRRRMVRQLLLRFTLTLANLIPYKLRRLVFGAIRKSSLVPSKSAWFVKWK